MREHETDPYVLRARREGYRSRAVYKLEELDQRDHLLRPGLTVVDLGAAPGGWCQYIQRRHGARVRVIALDVLPMDPVPGVTFLQGDFREAAVLARLEEALAGSPVDLVLSDLAPNISGVDAADQAGTVLLAELALDFARRHLRPGGTLLLKLFQGEGFDEFLKVLRQGFAKVAIRKPQASRSRSSEIYLLAQRLRVR
ncbi:MAG TPA: RlmE family RNA methyltransferase [Candidatus Binatia bacterium]|nr:RlmE family RNA methyltransferase [Candidatus Binatia bacterium]